MQIINTDYIKRILDYLNINYKQDGQDLTWNDDLDVDHFKYTNTND